MRRRRGFSLMELLIVVAIIALLISILLPTITRAREMASRTVCLSNIRQLQLGWLAYAEEHKGHFCTSSLSIVYSIQGSGPDPNRTASTPPALEGNGGWLSGPDQLGNQSIDFPNSRLWPYVHNINAYFCPNDTRPVKGVAAFTTFGSLASYGMNPLMGNEYITGDHLFGVDSNGQTAGLASTARPHMMTTLAQIRRPESTFVFIEVSPFEGSPGYELPILTTVTGIGAGLGLACPFHRGGSMAQGNTISFADGHAMFWNYTVPVDIATPNFY